MKNRKSFNNYDIEECAMIFEDVECTPYCLEMPGKKMSAYAILKLAQLKASHFRFDEAIHYYDRAIEMKPSERSFYFYRGICNYYLNDDKGSRSDFKVAGKNSVVYGKHIANFITMLDNKSAKKDTMSMEISAIRNRAIFK